MSILTDEEQSILNKALERKELMLKHLFMSDDPELTEEISPDVKHMRIAKEIMESTETMLLKTAEIRARAKADEDDTEVKRATAEHIKALAAKTNSLPDRDSLELDSSITFDLTEHELLENREVLRVKDFVKGDGDES